MQEYRTADSFQMLKTTNVTVASISTKLTPLMQNVMKIIHQSATCQYKVLLFQITIIVKTNKTTEAESHENNLDKLRA